MSPSRRAFLSTAGVVTLAGCVSRSDIPSWVPGTGHPLAGASTVRPIDQSARTRDYDALTEQALAYWNEHAEPYADVSVTFELDTDDPDVEILYTDSIEACGDLGTDGILGCAPILSSRTSVDKPVTATVLAGDRADAAIVTTAKHEIGHLLGLDHDDEPAAIMSNDPSKRFPRYEERRAVLEFLRESITETNDGTSAYNEGIEHWEAENDPAAAEAFDRSRRSYDRGLSAVETAITRAQELEELETVDSASVVASLEDARERIVYSIEAAEAMEDAVGARMDGDRLAANEHLEDANDAGREARGTPYPTVGEIAQALGLVHGTDDDATVDSS